MMTSNLSHLRGWHDLILRRHERHDLLPVLYLDSTVSSFLQWHSFSISASFQVLRVLFPRLALSLFALLPFYWRCGNCASPSWLVRTSSSIRSHCDGNGVFVDRSLQLFHIMYSNHFTVWQQSLLGTICSLSLSSWPSLSLPHRPTALIRGPPPLSSRL